MLNKGSVETEDSFDKNDFIFIQQGVISSDIECSCVTRPAPATDPDEWQDDRFRQQQVSSHKSSLKSQVIM